MRGVDGINQRTGKGCENMSKGNRTPGPRQGRAKLEPREHHCVRVLAGTWGAMVNKAGGKNRVGRLLEAMFGVSSGNSNNEQVRKEDVRL